MTTALMIAGLWLCAAALGVAAAARFGAFLDGKSDPDRRTRWNREAVHGRDDSQSPHNPHGKNVPR
jgi:cytochrome b